MQNQNYNNLIKELNTLLIDNQVQQVIDPFLNKRALKLIQPFKLNENINSLVNTSINIKNTKKDNYSQNQKSIVNHNFNKNKANLRNQNKSRDQISVKSKSKQKEALPKSIKPLTKQLNNTLNLVNVNKNQIPKNVKKYNLKQMLNQSMQSKQDCNLFQNIKTKSKINHSIQSQSKQKTISRSKSKDKLKFKSKSKTKFILKTQPCQNYLNNEDMLCKDKQHLFFSGEKNQNQDFQFPIQKESAQLEIIQLIQQKQSIVKQQKRILQLRTIELKQIIELQRQKIGYLNQQNILIQCQINKITQNNESYHKIFHIDRKKLQTIFNEVKNIHQSCLQATQQNEQTKGIIEQQKQLVGMYKTVIEQLKSQMKIEKQQLDEIKKNLNMLKKNQKVVKIKLNSVNESSTGMFQNLKESINKWKL